MIRLDVAAAVTRRRTAPTLPSGMLGDIIAANGERARLALQEARARVLAEELAPVERDAMKLCKGAT